MTYGTTTNRLHFIQRHPTARAVLRDGPCWAAACTRLPAPPFDSERTGPGRRPTKRNASPGAAPPFMHRNGAPDNHASQAHTHCAGRPPAIPTQRALRWNPHAVQAGDSKPLGAQTSWRPKHRERPNLERGRIWGEFGRVWEEFGKSLGEASFGEPALLLLSRRRGRGRCDGRSLALRGGVTCVPSAVVVAH
jgi:hypothetical protein